MGVVVCSLCAGQGGGCLCVGGGGRGRGRVNGGEQGNASAPGGMGWEGRGNIWSSQHHVMRPWSLPAEGLGYDSQGKLANYIA